MRLWDAATGAAVATLAGHTAGSRSVAFSPDGKRVLTGSCDKQHGCGTRRPAPRSRRSKDTASLSVRCLLAHGQRVLTGSYDGTARLWDAATGTEVATLRDTRAVSLPSPSRPTANAFHRLRRQDRETVGSFPSAQAEIDKVKASLPRCLTSEERKHFICERSRDGAMRATYGPTSITGRQRHRLEPTLRPSADDLG